MISTHENTSKWIGSTLSPQDISSLYLFRRRFHCSSDQATLRVRVSADSRYKLYINETLVSIGPCRGNSYDWHYEEVDLSAHLTPGTNVIAAEVLHFADREISRLKNISVWSVERTSLAAFLFDGALLDGNGDMIEDVSTDEKWKVKKEEGISFKEKVHTVFVSAFEDVDFQQMTNQWKCVSFDDSLWTNAKVITESYIHQKSSFEYGKLTPWVLKPSPIPQLTRIPKKLARVSATNLSSADINHQCKSSASKGCVDGGLDLLTSFIEGSKPLMIPPGKSIYFELDAGEYVTGYLNLIFKGGKGSTIKIVSSECYEKYDDGLFSKGVRDDSSGVLRGDYDLLRPDGNEIDYETYWFRSFRFLRVEISTGPNELILESIRYIDTTYPLDVIGSFDSSDDTHRKLWDVSIQTLKRCMHETYEDCPYFEQLQYTMDGGLQMLYTYQISADRRLADKCIDDFHSSLLPSGLITACAPNIEKQIIPGFCIYWILMLEDHMMHFGDINFLKKYRPTVDAILGWFDSLLTKEGLVGQTGYWAFVDWIEKWDMMSVPPANRVGPITIYSLMYARALMSAAKVNEFTGRAGIADEYLRRRGDVVSAVKNYCYDEEINLFTDGPGVRDFSQQTQVWAILSEAITGGDAAKLILRTLAEDMPKSSYSMSYYLFRTLEKTGLYHLVDKLFDPWRNLLDQNVTTWVESPEFQRSECHGWGSLPLYEFPAMILGVKPAKPGYKKISIKPHVGSLKYAKGTVSTALGPVSVDWRIDGKDFIIDIESPKDVEKVIVLPDGSKHTTTDNTISLGCALK